jgi:hypothetical protein
MAIGFRFRSPARPGALSSAHYVIVGRLIGGDREPIWKD